MGEDGTLPTLRTLQTLRTLLSGAKPVEDPGAWSSFGLQVGPGSVLGVGLDGEVVVDAVEVEVVSVGFVQVYVVDVDIFIGVIAR